MSPAQHSQGLCEVSLKVQCQMRDNILFEVLPGCWEFCCNQYYKISEFFLRITCNMRRSILLIMIDDFRTNGR